jgi:hypothetical protein
VTAAGSKAVTTRRQAVEALQAAGIAGARVGMKWPATGQVQRGGVLSLTGGD